MSLHQEQVACLCTVKAYREETTEHPTLQEAIVARHFLIHIDTTFSAAMYTQIGRDTEILGKVRGGL